MWQSIFVTDIRKKGFSRNQGIETDSHLSRERPRHWDKACCPHEHHCWRVCSHLPPRTDCSHHCQVKLEVSYCLLVRNMETHAQMGGAGSWGKVREKTKGFPVMNHCFLGNNFRSHHKVPSTCPSLYFVLKETVANEVLSHIWQPRGHMQGKGLRKSLLAHVTICTSPARSLWGAPVGGLKTPVPVLFFKWSKLYATFPWIVIAWIWR